MELILIQPTAYRTTLKLNEETNIAKGVAKWLTYMTVFTRNVAGE